MNELEIITVYDDESVHDWIVLSARNFPELLFLILLRVLWRS